MELFEQENKLMADRFEYKFLLPNDKLDSLRAELLPYVNSDPHMLKNGNKPYRVRSIYLDSKKMDCYYDKLEGIKVRNKFRIRGYNSKNEESILFLEIKRKYKDIISKNRAPFLHSNLKHIFNGEGLEKVITGKDRQARVEDAKKFLFHYHTKGLLPVVLVTYDREAYFGKFNNNLRLTCDRDIRSKIYPHMENLYDDSGFNYTLAGHFIFEVKFYHGLPTWIIEVIKKYRMQRLALSKFKLSIDTHNLKYRPQPHKMFNLVG